MYLFLDQAEYDNSVDTSAVEKLTNTPVVDKLSES